nr:tail fiber protein [uncultured Allomuricauda sp.]
MRKMQPIVTIILGTFLTTNAQVTNSFPNDGNVGIGTTTPSTKLHVAGNGAVIKLQNTSYEDTEDAFYGWLGGYDKSGDEIWWLGEGNGTNKQLGFYTNRAGYDINLKNQGKGIIIDDNGRVGIGTDSPSTLLEMKSTNSRAELTLIGTANGAINAGIVLKAIHSTNQRGLGMFMHDLGGTNEWFIGRPYSGSDQFVINRRSNTADHTTFASSLVHNNTSQITSNLFTLKANGNVGIGTTAPDSKLTVKGNIHAEEVKVDLSVPGPDYVFKEGYELKSLEEVKNYIKQNGHLPNIPSAEEMEKNGVQLGRMNMKLLEKIEELTLYVLKQQEDIKYLKAKIK